MAIIDVVSAALFFPEVLRMMIIFDLKADLLAHPMLTNHSIYIRTVHTVVVWILSRIGGHFMTYLYQSSYVYR